MVKVRVLKNNTNRAHRYTLATAGTFLFVNNICSDVIFAYCFFRACLFTFTAEYAHNRFIFTRIGKLCLNPQCRLLWIYLTEVLDSTDLHAEAAAGTVIPVYLDSHLNLPIIALFKLNFFASL